LIHFYKRSLDSSVELALSGFDILQKVDINKMLRLLP